VILASLLVSLLLTSTTKKSPEKIKVNITIDFGSSEKSKIVEVQNETTAFEALNSIAKVEYKEYAGMGKIITSIDNVGQNTTNAWMYFADDKLAPVSADNYFITKDTSINFRYMSNEEAMGYVS
jgi:hypothetical protein